MKRKALNVVKWWSKKHIGGIKGQLCMDGNKQRYNIYKDELLLLSTVFMGALFACLMIDAK